jgi:hypothetical protein
VIFHSYVSLPEGTFMGYMVSIFFDQNERDNSDTH